VFAPEEKLRSGGKIKKNSDFVEQRQWRQVFAPEEKLRIGGKI
jgi:hypothetical protein